MLKHYLAVCSTYENTGELEYHVRHLFRKIIELCLSSCPRIHQIYGYLPNATPGSPNTEIIRHLIFIHHEPFISYLCLEFVIMSLFILQMYLLFIAVQLCGSNIRPARDDSQTVRTRHRVQNNGAGKGFYERQKEGKVEFLLLNYVCEMSSMFLETCLMQIKTGYKMAKLCIEHW